VATSRREEPADRDAPVFISAQAVADTLDYKAAADAVRRVYELMPPGEGWAGRIVARGDGARVRALAAVLPDRSLMGAKLHAQAADGNSSFLIALYSAQDGTLKGLIDGRAITQLRTGATSAVALEALAPPTRLKLAVLGSGAEAHAHLRALAAVRQPDEVYVYSPTPASREAFAATMQDELGIKINVSETAEDAVQACSALIAAARSRDEVPIFDPDALRPGTVVVSVGSTVPDQRELDHRVLERAALIVTDEPMEVLSQSGDCIVAQRAGIDLRSKTFALTQLLQGTLPTAIDDSAINVFKSVGSALQDLAVAKVVLQRASGSGGAAVPLPISLTPKERRG
jgi:alanine dehydrogenase